MPGTLIIISPGFPSNEHDSTCLPARQMFVAGLKKQFPHLPVIVLALQYPFEEKAYEWKGVQVISFNGRNRGRQHRLALWLSVWRRLQAIRRKNSITGILSFWLGECALVGKIFSRRYGIPHFTWLLGQDAKAGNRYARLVKPAAGELIALSDFIADTFEKNYSTRPLHVIPVGIDTGMLLLKTQERSIDVMGAGSLIPLKRYDVFIKVIHSLAAKNPGIRAVICGDGEQRQTLQQMVRQLGLEKNISLAGEVPHESVFEMMQRSRVFLHPSSYEGFGSVCAEALYAGAQLVTCGSPMHELPLQWHLAAGETQMIHTTDQLLSGVQHAESILPFTSTDIAARVMQLFGSKVEA